MTDYDIMKDKNIKEISIIEIGMRLWAKRRFIIVTTSFFVSFGLIVGVLTPNEYTASSIMVPQVGEKRASGGISGLAAMAGINIGSLSSGDILSPNLYPYIINNINFKKELIYSKFNFEYIKDSITYFEFSNNKKYKSFNFTSFIKKYTIGLPGLIIGNLKGNKGDVEIISADKMDIERLTYFENKAIKEVYDCISINFNSKDGYIVISAKTNQPQLSAEIVFITQKLLQKYLTDFKLEKVRSNLAFVDFSYLEAKRNFEDKQVELANYRDANKNLSSAIAKTNEEKLTSEYNLLFELYTEISKQKEQAKIAVTETTPILTIVQPVVIPNEKSGPNRLLIMFGFLITGMVVSFAWTIYKDEIVNIFNFISKS